MEKRKLKIAIFHLAFFYSGGGEKLVLEEIRELKKRGHRVDCFVPTIDKKLCFPDVINHFKIKTFFPPFPKIIPHKESFEILFASMFFPIIARRFIKYDVILGANQPGPWFAWLTNKLLEKPYIIYLAQPTRILYPRKVDRKEGVWVKHKAYILPLLVKLGRPFIKWADKVSIRGAGKMLVNGNYIGEVLKKTYKKNYISCPAGARLVLKINGERWEGNIRVNGLNIKKPYILITNRHFPQKKFEYAIEALVQILKKIPNVSLVISGNPTNYTQFLKKLVQKRKAEKNVVFTGFVSEKDLFSLYSNACVYVYTSPEEDFGMGIIEAMAVGIPAVAWNKGGPSTTIINGKTGFLVMPYKQKEFAEKIIYLLKNKKENIEMGKKGWERVKKNYTYDKHIDTIEKSLFEVMHIYEKNRI